MHSLHLISEQENNTLSLTSLLLQLPKMKRRGARKRGARKRGARKRGARKRRWRRRWRGCGWSRGGVGFRLSVGDARVSRGVTE
jgi:hypothetical protein